MTAKEKLVEFVNELTAEESNRLWGGLVLALLDKLEASES